MKKINFLFLLLLMMVVVLFPAQEKKVKKQKSKIKYTWQKAAAYQEESLLISESDLNCTYFIKKGLSEDLRIKGAEDMDMGKKDYSDGDKLYIGKGSEDGIKENDIFLVLEKVKKIPNHLTARKLGTYYQKKSLAEVTQIYEDKAVITLKKGCHPVNIGDILIPYQKQDTVFEKKLNYLKATLPKSPIEGNVVYINGDLESEREIVGMSDYVTVDLDMAVVKKGDWLLFYKTIRDDLPPIIMGSGIVIDSQNNNSTVKIIDSAFPVTVGTRLVKIRKAVKRRTPGEDMEEFTPDEDEDVPSIEPRDEEEAEEESGDTLELDILFDLNKASISDKYKKELEKIKDFIHAKSAYTIILRGYSCSIGGLEYNLRLSKKRVDSVKKYLMEKYKIKKDFFETYHYGEKDTPFKNTSEQERKKNRLVNIEVIGK